MQPARPGRSEDAPSAAPGAGRTTRPARPTDPGGGVCVPTAGRAAVQGGAAASRAAAGTAAGGASPSPGDSASPGPLLRSAHRLASSTRASRPLDKSVAEPLRGLGGVPGTPPGRVCWYPAASASARPRSQAPRWQVTDLTAPPPRALQALCGCPAGAPWRPPGVSSHPHLPRELRARCPRGHRHRRRSGAQGLGRQPSALPTGRDVGNFLDS